MDLSKFSFLPLQAAKNYAFGDEQSLSPMTELAVNLEQSSMSTPRRKLSLSNSLNPTPERSESLESGFEPGSPLLDPLPDFDHDSPTLENIRARKFSGPPCNNSSSLRRQLMSRRSFSSPVLSRKPFEPLDFNELSPSPSYKKHYGVKSSNILKPINNFVENVEENHSDLSLCEMSDHFPDFEDSYDIKKRKYIGRSHSAPTVSPDSLDIFDSGSSGYSNGSNDDGFFDELSNDNPDCDISTSAPTNFMGLINDPIFAAENKVSDADKENQVPKSNPIFIKPVGIPLRSRSCSLPVKRDSPATQSPSPIKRKKRPRHGICRSKSFYESNPNLLTTEKKFELPNPVRALQRSQSFDVKHTNPPGVDITKLFDMDDKNLIGDKSKNHCLPTCPSKHPDLKGITPETMAALLNGEYKDMVEEFFIIDSRYPYEFEGGHIKHALNIYEKQDLMERFLKSPPTKAQEKRQILIFHCEFSSKRGPAMSRFLRNKDRDAHQDSYPQLYYPEMYLLEGGYKQFYAQESAHCEPQKYREMLDPDYQSQLKLFTKRSKSWSEDKASNRRRRPILRY